MIRVGGMNEQMSGDYSYASRDRGLFEGLDWISAVSCYIVAEQPKTQPVFHIRKSGLSAT